MKSSAFRDLSVKSSRASGLKLCSRCHGSGRVGYRDLCLVCFGNGIIPQDDLVYERQKEPTKTPDGPDVTT